MPKSCKWFLFYIDVVSCCFYFRFQIFSFQTNNYNNKIWAKTILANSNLISLNKKKRFTLFNGSALKKAFLSMTHKIEFLKKSNIIEIVSHLHIWKRYLKKYKTRNKIISTITEDFKYTKIGIIVIWWNRKGSFVQEHFFLKSYKSFKFDV